MDDSIKTLDIECPNCGKVSISEQDFDSMTVCSDGNIVMAYICPMCGTSVVFDIPTDEETASEFSSIVKVMSDYALSSDFEPFFPYDDPSLNEDFFDESEEESLTPVEEIPAEEEEIAEPAEDVVEIETAVDAVEDPESVYEVEETEDEAIESEEESAFEEEAQAEEPMSKEIDIPEVYENEHHPVLPTINPEDRASQVKPSAHYEGHQININYSMMPNSGTLTFGFQIATPERKIPTCTPTDYEMAQLEYFHRQIEQLGSVDEAIDEIDAGYKPNETN